MALESCILVLALDLLLFSAIHFHSATYISRRRRPHRLNILLHQLPLHAGVSHLPRQARLRDLLHKPQSPNRSFPIADILSLELNDGHAWIIRSAIMDTIAQIAEPSGSAFRIEVFDPGVGVGGGGYGAGDGDPVLGGRILEGQVSGLVVGEVFKFVGVLVGEEEEIGSFALWRPNKLACFQSFFPSREPSNKG